MSRLEVIMGTEIVDDIRLGHTFYEVVTLQDFVLSKKPEWFIEIGVHEGGLSYMLIPVFLPIINYLGIEIDCSLIRPQVRNLYESNSNAMLWCGDVFTEHIFEGIQARPNKIIYCDGGNKAKEILVYKDACNSGDIIMCHDFSDGKRKVRNIPNYSGREFPKPEVLLKDIEVFEDDPSFIRLPEDIFNKTRIVGWEKK